MLDRWSKKRRNENFLHKERDLIPDMDKLLGIFCQDLSRKRGLEKQNDAIFFSGILQVSFVYCGSCWL